MRLVWTSSLSLRSKEETKEETEETKEETEETKEETEEETKEEIKLILTGEIVERKKEYEVPTV